MSHKVKCKYCGEYFDKDKIAFKQLGRLHAHIQCYEKYYDPDEDYKDQIYQLLKELNISVNYTACERQRKSYMTKYGYTNEGMYNALRYFYCVQKQSAAKSDNRIGIIPYIYDAAEEYYRKFEKKQEVIAKIINSDIQATEIKIKAPEKRKIKQYIDMDIIGDEDDR